MAKSIKITAVYGVKDNGELVNIAVEGNSDEVTQILLTIWGNKQNRNLIRQISSGEFNESIAQDIIKSAQCECGAQITIKVFCLADSAISDTWSGELQCLEIGEEAAVTVAEIFKVEGEKEVEEAEEVKEEEIRLPEPLPLETPVLEKEEEEIKLPESLPLEPPDLGKEEEAAVTLAEVLETEEIEEIKEAEEVEELREEEEEEIRLPDSRPLEPPDLGKEEEVTVTVAEVL